MADRNPTSYTTRCQFYQPDNCDTALFAVNAGSDSATAASQADTLLQAVADLLEESAEAGGMPGNTALLCRLAVEAAQALHAAARRGAAA